MPKKVCKQSTGGSSRNRTCTLKYELEVRGVRIIFCKKCFLATLDENDGFVKRVMDNKKRSLSGVTSTDRRGRKPSVRKTPDATVEAINRHIHGFPKYSSHYGRSHTSRMYLGIGLSIQTMFEDYTVKGNPKTSRSTYSREFRKTGLKFKPPQIDTCQKCDTFAVALKSASSEDQKSEIVREHDEHHENSQLAYQTKKQDKANQTEESRVASFDLQQVLACPQMTAGTVFYKRQLNVYNLTIFDCFKKQGINHMWTEIEAGRGANEISSCLTHYISSGIPPCVKKLTLWSDTCSGQNKNSIVCAALITAVATHPSLEIIDQKFLVPGHTHMECDQVHAQIEKKKRRTSAELHHPSNFYNFVRSVEYRKESMDVVEMKDKFLDFAATLQLKLGGPLIHRQKNRDGDPFCFTNVQWFRYQRQNPTTIQYKESLKEDVPFKEVSFRRRGKLGSKALKPQPCNSEEIPISVEKKKDLLELLPLVNPVYHDFYRNIRTSDDQIDVDPDCVPPQDVSEEIHRTLLDED
ncbi:hypothetical protein FOCC_FOCC012377 [Frankliniella occidentalis]|nr:hypothetical protein FOCC_FOCC012377 [Frankliniella occidentalis]